MALMRALRPVSFICVVLNDGDTIFVEPWRAAAFPVIKDLVVDRTSFDRIVEAGGYVSVNTGKCSGCECNTHRQKSG